MSVANDLRELLDLWDAVSERVVKIMTATRQQGVISIEEHRALIRRAEDVQARARSRLALVQARLAANPNPEAPPEAPFPSPAANGLRGRLRLSDTPDTPEPSGGSGDGDVTDRNDDPLEVALWIGLAVMAAVIGWRVLHAGIEFLERMVFGA